MTKISARSPTKYKIYINFELKKSAYKHANTGYQYRHKIQQYCESI